MSCQGELFLGDKNPNTNSETKSKDMDQHETSDHHGSTDSFHSCHSITETNFENRILLVENPIKSATKLKNHDIQHGMSKSSKRHVTIDANHTHKKASIMTIDRSKYIYSDGQFLPIDYILVYTRYQSNGFRRGHKMKRHHDEYRQFFHDCLRKLGFIVVEERLTDEENDLLNLRQAEVSPDVHENTSDESNHVFVRGLSTIQRHMSLRFQNISTHLKKDPYNMTRNVGVSTNIIREEETAKLRSALDNSKDDNPTRSKKASYPISEREEDSSQDERYFVKIHAPFEVLLVLAEKMKLKLPFSENKAPLKPGLFDQGLLCQFTRLDPREFPESYNGKHYFTASYQKSLHYRFSQFFGDVDKVFRPAERSRLVYETLLRCPYQPQETSVTVKNGNSEVDPRMANHFGKTKLEREHASEEKTLKIEEVFTASTRGSGMKDTGNGKESD